LHDVAIIFNKHENIKQNYEIPAGRTFKFALCTDASASFSGIFVHIYDKNSFINRKRRAPGTENPPFPVIALDFFLTHNYNRIRPFYCGLLNL